MSITVDYTNSKEVINIDFFVKRNGKMESKYQSLRTRRRALAKLSKKEGDENKS